MTIPARNSISSRRTARRNAIAPVNLIAYDRIVPSGEPPAPESPGGTVDLTGYNDREPLADITNLFWTGPAVILPTLPVDTVCAVCGRSEMEDHAGCYPPVFTDAVPNSDLVEIPTVQHVDADGVTHIVPVGDSDSDDSDEDFPVQWVEFLDADGNTIQRVNDE